MNFLRTKGEKNIWAQTVVIVEQRIMNLTREETA